MAIALYFSVMDVASDELTEIGQRFMSHRIEHGMEERMECVYYWIVANNPGMVVCIEHRPKFVND